MRGQGRIFQRKGSSAFWISYYHRGKEVRESARSDNRKDAEKLLKQRIKEIGADSLGARAFIGPQQERVTVDELLDALIEDYRIRGKATKKFESHLKPLRAVFSDLRAVDCNEGRIDRVVSAWLSEKKAPATINRELQILGQAFRLAVDRKRLSMAPKVRRLPNADRKRQGFFERAELEKVVKHLPPDLQDFTWFGFFTGWRKGEITSLEWSDVDLNNRIIHLKGEHSKNGEPRKVALYGELWDLIQRRLTHREIITEQGVQVYQRVFHSHGKSIGDFRRIWLDVCKKGGVQGRIFHDLRRTAIRNMTRAGISEQVAMKISGHRTRSVFDRYNITSENDLREAAQRMEIYVKSLPAESEQK